MKVEPRWARDADGARIAELAEACHFVLDGVSLDWSRVEPYWIVCELDGRIVAAIQVLPALPLGRMDYLFVDPDLSKRERGVAVLRITDYATAMLRFFGASLAASYIQGDREDEYLRVAERRGWRKLFETVAVFKRLI